MSKGSGSRLSAGRWAQVVSWSLIVVASLLAFKRYKDVGNLDFVTPEEIHEVSIMQTFDSDGSEVRLKTFLPVSDSHQTIVAERNTSSELDFSTISEEGNRIGEWRGVPTEGQKTVVYHFQVHGQGLRYEIDPGLMVEQPQPSGAARKYLEPTDVIQSTNAEIMALSDRLMPPGGRVADYLKAVFDEVQGLKFKPFKGTTDALTALRLGEASCNGRSRLFVALMRARGLPARLVGGLVMTQGEKQTSHQWVEVLVGGHWVPMDPTNDHFARLPHHYLTLYRGDEALFKHTTDIGFHHLFKVRREMVPRQTLETNKTSLGLWGFFSEIGIPLDLLRVVIMIPLGAVVVVLFRNVVGLKTFGTFLPVLIAASARHTGLLWGMVGFVALILFASGVRRVTARLELLHSPQLAVLLTAVIGGMLFGGRAAVELGFTSLGRISLFPVAILAITAERFTLMEIEEGAREAWWTMARTLLVVAFCYLTINSLSLQILMLAFPELLLLVAAINIWLGRWVGLRMTEWIRFRGLMWGGAGA